MATKRKNTEENGKELKRSRLNVSMELSQSPDFHNKFTMNSEAEAGIIEAVSIKNFMCHSKLEFSFGPHVNFLLGNNGSGKSAVLTAIIIGLGGKASLTNRGNSLKSFIKTGKRMAEVSIKLRNSGPDAYNHDVFGDSITIERKLLCDGGGSYKLKSSKSNVTISKKDELISILDHFNIQVDNPVTILNQEASKTFLRSKSPQDLYKFFLKATQLEQTNQDYVAAAESKRVAAEVIKQKEKTLPDIEKDVLHWKQKFNACDSLVSLKDKISRLKKELAWAIIGERQRNLEPTAKELKAETLRTPKFDQKVEECEAKVMELEKEHDQLQDEVKRLREEVGGMKPEHLEAKNLLINKKNAVRKAQEVHRKVCLERDSVTSDKRQIEQRVKELRQKDYSEYDEQRRVRQDRICILDQQLNDQRARLKILENDLGLFQGAVSKIEQELSQARFEEKAANSEIQRTESQLNNYVSARNDKLKRYGEWMPAAVRRIDEAFRQGRLTKRPFGPIGANIAIRDPKWALAIEVCLGPLITGFYVNNYNDERIVEEILSQMCPNRASKPPIFTSTFQPVLYNVPKNPTHYPTVLEMLDIADPILTNCIIDQRGVEGILLFENAAHARSVMHNPPAGFPQAFTVGGDQLYAFPTFRMYSSEKSRAQFLTPSLEDIIKQFQEELSQQKSKLQQLQVKTKHLDNDRKRTFSEKRTAEMAVLKVRQTMSAVDMEIKELKNFEEPQPIDVSTLEAEANELTARLQELDASIAAELEKVSEAKKDQEEVQRQFQEMDQRMRNAAEGLDPIKSRFEELGNELETARQHRKHYVMKRKEHEKKLLQLQKEHDTRTAEIQLDREKALQICEEIRTRRTAQNIENEIVQIKKQVHTEESRRGDRDEIMRTYQEKQLSFDKVKRELNQISNFLRKLDESLGLRTAWFQKQKQSLTLRTKLYFINYLRSRNYQGKLNICHRNETIEPVIYPTVVDGAKMRGPSNKALSGGERSFSTACFILSLWDGINSPFRCLDEYDIYMDMVNRRITMDMMMKFAANKRGSQFIFLSPLDMGGMLSDPSLSELDLRIFEMQPPERGLSNDKEEDED